MVEITKYQDLQAGDIATFEVNGAEYTGPVIRVGRYLKWASVALHREAEALFPIRGSQFRFVRAERPAPLLPTEPGSVGWATVRGVPDVLVILDEEGDWMTAERVNGHFAHPPERLFDFVPGKVVKS